MRTSRARSCRWRTKAERISLVRGLGVRAISASTAAVTSCWFLMIILFQRAKWLGWSERPGILIHRAQIGNNGVRSRPNFLKAESHPNCAFGLPHDLALAA